MKYDAATKTYYLYSVDGLKWLSKESNTNSNQFFGYTVKLTSDVDMTGISFDPIGKAKHSWVLLMVEIILSAI